jgi:proteasome lid subunit RPN8/RPN11
MSQETIFGSWAVTESPLTIEYSLVVIEEIRNAVNEGFQRLSRGGLEVGGVLYGTHEGNAVRIQAMREIVCEHARGPSFLLSDNDRAALTEQLARGQEDHRLEGLVAVGWFLSHTRGEITLTESDLETFNAFFAAPWQITLVIRPGRAGVTRAGFFVRENDGAVKSDRSYLDFSFPDRPAAPDRPPRDRGAPGDRRNAPLRDAPPDAMASAGYDAPLFGQPSGSIPQYLPYPETRRRWPWGLIAVVMAVAVLAVLGLRLFAPPAAPEPIALSVAERDGQLQIQWNHSSRTISGAARGTLDITDGQDSRSIPLTQLELSRGSFNYLRKSGDVEIRMTVEDSAGEKTQEASRFLGSAPAAGDPNELDAIRLERDSLQDQIATLKAQNKQQADRIQQLERTLVILQTRLGIGQGKR